MRKTHRTTFALAAAVAVAIAACGQSDDGATGSTMPLGAPPTTSPAEPAITAEPAAPPVTSAPGQGVRRVELCGDVPVITTEVIGTDVGASGIDPVFHGVLQTYAAEHQDAFGGIWIDREAGGTIVIAFTDDAEHHRSALAARQPSPEDIPAVHPAPEVTDDRPLGEWDVPFDVVQVTWTEDELVELSGAVVGHLHDAGVRIDGAGVDVMRNRVSIHLPGVATPTDVDHIADAIEDGGISSDALCVDAEISDEVPEPIEPGTPLDVIVLPDADGTYPPDTEVECAGTRFRLGALADLTPLDEVSDDLRAVVDSWLSDGDPGFVQDGWALLHEDGDTATFITFDDDAVWFIGAEMGRNGWIWSGASGGGTCDVNRVLPDGLGSVEWELDPAAPAPDADSTEVRLLLTEMACTGGSELGERLLGPEVVETDDAVRIAFAAIPLVGGHTCPGNPPTPVTVTLDAPLGDRELLDGLAVGPITHLADR